MALYAFLITQILFKLTKKELSANILGNFSCRSATLFEPTEMRGRPASTGGGRRSDLAQRDASSAQIERLVAVLVEHEAVSVEGECCR